MGLGTSLLLIAAGAILKWAVTASVAGVNLQTVGLILLIIGLVGFLISLYWMATAADRRTGREVRVVNPEADRGYSDPAPPPRF